MWKVILTALRLNKGEGSRSRSAQVLPQGTISFQYLQLYVFWGGRILTLNLQTAPTHSAPPNFVLHKTLCEINTSSLKAQVWLRNGLLMFQHFPRSEMMGAHRAPPPQTSCRHSGICPLELDLCILSDFFWGSVFLL